MDPSRKPTDDLFQELLRDHWGRYIAFYEAGEGPRVLADPVGSWPLWFLRGPDLTIVADRITPELAKEAGLT